MEEAVNKKITTVLLAILFAGLWCNRIATAGGFQLNEHGARALGQGGAFTARAGDPSAIFFNGAGLSFLSGTNIMLGATAVIPSTTFRGPIEYNTNAETKMDKQIFTPPNVYITHSMDNGLSFGAGVFTPYGLGTEWPDNWVGRGITTKIELQTFFINPTVAYRILPQLSISAGFDYVFANVTLKKKITNFSPEGDLSLKGDGHGTGFTAGILYKPMDIVSVGASYRSKTKLDLSGTANFSNLPAPAVVLFPGGDVSTSITTPANYFIGVAVKPINDLEIEFDYQGIGWSSYNELPITFTTQTAAQTNQVQIENYKDTYMLRIGAEYTYCLWQFRAGYIYDHSPVEDAYVDPLLPDANRNDICVGVGYKLTESIQLDVAYMFVGFKQRTVTNTISQFDGTYNSTADLFGLDISYRF